MKEVSRYLKNDIAIEVLGRLGLNEPNQQQVDLIQTLTANVTMRQSLYFKGSLSKRERECLFWSACGKSSRELAGLFDIKLSTVNWYKKEILRKLDCKNIAHAVFVGMRYGYLSQSITD